MNEKKQQQILLYKGLKFKIYLLQDGSARKQPFPIDVQLGSIMKKKHNYNLFSQSLYTVFRK